MKRSLHYLFVGILCEMFCLAGSAYAELVAHWAFDEADGASVAKDATGNYDASQVGSGITMGQAGVFGSAVNFNGTRNSELKFDHLEGIYSTDLSFSFWINPAASTNNSQIIGAWQNTWSFRIYMEENGTISSNFRKETSDSSVPMVAEGNSVSAMPLNDWTHVALVMNRSAGTLSTYVNGALTQSKPMTSASGTLRDSAGTYSIGRKQDGGPTINASLDELYVFSHALSERRIQGLYQSNNELALIQPSAIHLNRLIGTTASTDEGALFDANLENSTKGSYASTSNMAVDLVGTSYSSNVNAVKEPGFRITSSDQWTCNLSNLKPATIYQNVGNTLCGRNSEAPADSYAYDCIGIHASNFITYDLDEIRTLGEYAPDTIFSFTSDLVQIHQSTGPSTYAEILLSNDEGLIGGYVNNVWFDAVLNADGDYVLDISDENPLPAAFQPMAADSSLGLSALVMPDAKYLTLMISGFNGNATNAHFAFNDPTLAPFPEPAAWLLLLCGIPLLWIRQRAEKA